MKGKPEGLKGRQREETRGNEHAKTRRTQARACGAQSSGETWAETCPPRAQGTGVRSGGSHSLGARQEGTRRP